MTGSRSSLRAGIPACFMDALCKMIGTGGTFIAENGGVYRVGYTGTLRLDGDQGVCRTALEIVQAHYRKKGIELELYNPTYRYTDLAFARTVPAEEVSAGARRPTGTGDRHRVCHPSPVRRCQQGDRPSCARTMTWTSPQKTFLLSVTGSTTSQMLEWAGRGVTIANAHPATKTAASDVMEEAYGKGFVQATKKYRSYFRAM